MKTIVFEDNDGVKNFLVFSSEKKAISVFNKMCHSQGRYICTSEKRFEKIKEKNVLSDMLYKSFVKTGIYDYDGNFYEKLIQPEGSYYIEDFSERTKNIKTTRIKIDFLFLN